MKWWFKNPIDKAVSIADKAVIDKDKRIEFIYNIASMMLQSRIAPYVRAILGILIVVSCMYFGDKLTIDAETQKYCLYSVLSFYFIDFIRSMFNSKNKKK